ncbi:DUF2771 family protein [Dietzia sp. 179-F 9C3 NHS]|uniref:DUF2771 family protein n=1 Tax=Dietzia sp. 179-F 9C3 NHS TaxID=3374295 RepID=UPI00387A42EA
MSSTSTSESSRRRIRPVTWAILAWMVIMIAAILGAWQGSESRHGALPEITVTTERGHQKVLPFTATDLDGNTFTNPVAEYRVHDEGVIGVRLPSELRRAALAVVEMRENGVHEREIQPGGPGQLRIPVMSDDLGRLEGLAIMAGTLVYNADGEETLLNGEWSVGFLYDGEVD